MSMNRYGSKFGSNCSCHHRHQRDGLLGDRFDRFDRDDRYDMRGRLGLRDDRYDDMYRRRGAEFRRDRHRRGCCW